jgi:signal transduction histidine kinase
MTVPEPVPRAGGEKLNILLVDDQPGKLLTYEAILESLGENLLKASSAREAFQILLHTDVAVVLVDVCMPELDGYELASMIRQHPRFRSTSIILVSAVFTNDVDRVKGYSSGAMDYLPVPVVPEILRAKVAVFVDLYRKTRQLEALNHELEDRVRERTAELEASTAQLRSSEEELRAADRHKDEFLALLAHELRNPVAPIRNAAQILMLRGASDPELLWNVQVIDRQVRHLTRLIDDLLDLSRISRGRLELRRSRVTLTEVIDSALESSRPSIERHGHVLATELPTRAVHLDADLVRLSQVFMNLLNNSAKYTPDGGRIELVATLEEASGEPSAVTVRVRDTGIGIEPAKLPRLFEMFVQLDGPARRADGGLGIGLALVRHLVQLHGGTVEAHSEGPGRGSEFVVRLPVAPPAVAAGGSGSSTKVAGAESGRRILVVDDMPDNAASLTVLLRRLGHRVETAFGGREALAMAADFRPQVVLLDIGMPDLDGFEVCRRIRSEPWGREIFVSALSGWGQESDQRRAVEAGFDALLVKPLDYDLLETMLSRVDERGAARATLASASGQELARDPADDGALGGAAEPGERLLHHDTDRRRT